ncbi:MAG TPA: hypothetical protein VER98_12155 [Terriglobia bacterium]|nr:hypothetical protein [Terriglobia bacterium]
MASLVPSNSARLLGAALLALSVWNAGWMARQNYHWPVFVEDDWARLDRDLTYAKGVLSRLPDRHIEYRTEGASDTYDTDTYYRLQNILAPSILQRDTVEDRYVLVEFWTTRTVVPLADLTLVEDLGHGFGLYRRP